MSRIGMMAELECDSLEDECEYQDADGLTVAELLVALNSMLAEGETSQHSVVQLRPKHLGDAMITARCTGDGTVILGSY